MRKAVSGERFRELPPPSGLENRLGEEIPLAAFDNDPRLLSAEEFDASHGPGWLQGLIDSIKARDGQSEHWESRKFSTALKNIATRTSLSLCSDCERDTPQRTPKWQTLDQPLYFFLPSVARLRAQWPTEIAGGQ